MLTLAGLKLVQKKGKIIDVAAQYGYEIPVIVNCGCPLQRNNTAPRNIFRGATLFFGNEDHTVQAGTQVGTDSRADLLSLSDGNTFLCKGFFQFFAVFKSHGGH